MTCYDIRYVKIKVSMFLVGDGVDSARFSPSPFYFKQGLL